MTVDQAKVNFESYLSKYDSLIQEDLSESDTRSKIIDKILIEVLGWEEVNIEREGHVESGYYDYKLAFPGFRCLLEAKRNFSQFSLPSGYGNRKVTLSTLLTQNESVITQIRNYALDSGIPYGIITNGKQFIIGRFINTDGTNWKSNKCLIFDGFEDILSHFIDFYNNLSRVGIIENGGFKFSTYKEVLSSQKIVSTLVDREKEIIRNTISSKITPLIDFVFGEIFSEEDASDLDFIKECFVENKEIKKNRDEIERLFLDSPPVLSEIIPAANTQSVIDQIESEINTTGIPIKEKTPPKPIIIVGSKGAGKTTFINYLFTNKLSPATLEKHPYVYLDFRRYFSEVKDFDIEIIADDILKSLFDKYESLMLHSSKVLRRVYYKEIKRNDESIWEEAKNNDPTTYSQKLSRFFEERLQQKLSHLEYLSRYLIRERRLRLIVILDNADQFDVKIQEKAFLLSSSLNRKAHCGVFVSLREGYYYKWRHSPPFDAFESNVYHITAPKYSEVLQRRIDYTLKKLNVDGVTEGVSEQGYKITLPNQDIYEFLHGLQSSLFDESNSKIIDFLSYSTYPNIREGLRLFKLFLISGYTDVSEYILRVRYNQAKDRIIIPMHEFIKSIGLYNKLYYNHEISSIANLFYPSSDSTDHFLKYWLLKYLLGKFDTGGNVSKYIKISQIIDDFANFGYQINIVKNELFELLKLECIESDEIISDTEWSNLPVKEFNIAISPKGYYYIRELKNRFHYLDLVLQDTPVFDKDLFNRIKTAFPLADDHGKRSLSKRLDVVIEFVDYLKNRLSLQPIELLHRFGNIVDEIMNSGLSSDIERIQAKIDVIK